MTTTPHPDLRDGLLDALLDSWDRNNTIMRNLLRAVPDGGLDARATEAGATVAQQFMHLCHERLISVAEEAPEHARPVPEQEWPEQEWPAQEWIAGHGRDRIAQLLTESGQAVHDAVRDRVLAGRQLERSYDHPILMLQLLLWHEGYHHGQIKLALKIAGRAISDDEAGPITWDVWRARRDA